MHLAPNQPDFGLAIFASYYDRSVSTMNISLPDSLKEFVEEQVAKKGYGTSSEYVRELIRRDQGRQQLRSFLLEGAQSGPAAPAMASYFDALRESIRKQADG